MGRHRAHRRRLLADDPAEIVGIGVRDRQSERPDLPPTATLITDPSSIAELRPDVVAEAAGRDSVEPWGRAALAAGADLIVSSVSAFADAGLLTSMRDDAERSGRSIHIPPGALGGIDALAAARAMGIDTVEHRIVKPPAAWRGTPAEQRCDLDGLHDEAVLLEASAAETAAAYPRNANVP